MPHDEGVLFEGVAIVDACSLINLYASQRIKEILPHIATTTVVTKLVATEEATHVYDSQSQVKPRPRVVIDLKPLQATGLLTVVDLESEDEAELFVELAASLDDGEAMTGAIAIRRQMMMVTDDRRATKVLREHTASINLITTPEIVKHWAKMSDASEPDVRLVINEIRRGAVFTIQRGHQLTDWWRAYEEVSR